MEEEEKVVVKNNLNVKDVAFNSATTAHTELKYKEPSASALSVTKCKKLRTQRLRRLRRVRLRKKSGGS